MAFADIPLQSKTLQTKPLVANERCEAAVLFWGCCCNCEAARANGSSFAVARLTIYQLLAPQIANERHLTFFYLPFIAPWEGATQGAIRKQAKDMLAVARLAIYQLVAPQTANERHLTFFYLPCIAPWEGATQGAIRMQAKDMQRCR